MPRPVDLSRARQSDINRDTSSAAVTPAPPGPPRRASVDSVAATPTPATLPEPPARQTPKKRPTTSSAQVNKRRREVQVTVPTHVRDLIDGLPESRSDVVRIAYNRHYQDLPAAEPEQSAGPMTVGTRRRRRRTRPDDPMVPLMLRLTEAERDMLDDLAKVTAMSRSGVVTALLERFIADSVQ